MTEKTRQMKDWQGNVEDHLAVAGSGELQQGGG